MQDKIRFPHIIAKVVNNSALLPSTKSHRILLMKLIAQELYLIRGSFFFSQIDDILRQAYSSEIIDQNEEILSEELEEWLINESYIESIGEDGLEEAYIFKSI